MALQSPRGTHEVRRVATDILGASGLGLGFRRPVFGSLNYGIGVQFMTIIDSQAPSPRGIQWNKARMNLVFLSGSSKTQINPFFALTSTLTLLLTHPLSRLDGTNHPFWVVKASCLHPFSALASTYTCARSESASRTASHLRMDGCVGVVS